jgi:FkbM family methyltransferase
MSWKCQQCSFKSNKYRNIINHIIFHKEKNELTSTYDNITYFGACPSFHYHIVKGISQPYTRELDLVKKYLIKNPNKNNTYLDIGGHIGTTSLPYSKLFSQIIVYEPTKNNYKHLLKNIEYNKLTNIIAKNVGVFNKNMKGKIIKHGKNSGCYHIKESGNIDSIDIIKLDNENIKTQVDFIKIDTEGSELYVLEGAKNLIKKCKPLIQVETTDHTNKLYNYDKKKIYDFLFEIGYKIYNDNGVDPIFYY